MPRAIHIASGAADAQAVADAATLVGFSVRESAGSAAVATVIIRNGDSDAAPAVAMIELAADGSQTAKLPAIDCPDGIFVERVAGSTELAIYVL
jgi:hypothetical protein